jgi:hypothetical protein
MFSSLSLSVSLSLLKVISINGSTYGSSNSETQARSLVDITNIRKVVIIL